MKCFKFISKTFVNWVQNIHLLVIKHLIHMYYLENYKFKKRINVVKIK